MGNIHHIELNVSDLEGSIRFWGWFLEELGYQPFQVWDEGRSWKKDETYLVFVQTKEHFIAEGYHRGRTGLNLLAFQANSRQQVDNLAKKLEEKVLKFYIKINTHLLVESSIMQYFLKIQIELKWNL